MRPHRLSLHGLHSFAEPMSVDFDALGAYGLFGIFGPVGAGKSTLLDAITLALYGQVDRLQGRSRDGLINPHCKYIDVAFTFTIGDEMWQARRRFKRRAGSVVTELAQLTRVGHEVVAEKDGEVNRAVVELLGLEAEDFMRAVVLPQGKFAAFLSLKGTQRREMLQRLFGLTAFGKRLRERIRSRIDGLNTERAELEGELRGLGDASPEALQALQQSLHTTRQAHRQLGLELAVATAAVDNRQRIRNATVAASLAAQQLSEHVKAHNSVDKLAENVARAHAARRIARPAQWATDCLQHAQTTSITLQSCMADVEEVTSTVAAATTALAAATVDPNQASLRHQRLQQLTVAVDARRNLDQVSAELAPLVNAAQVAHEEVAVRAATLDQLAETLREDRTQRRRLQQQVTQNTVEHRVRRQVQQAAVACDKYVAAQRTAAANQQRCQQAKQVAAEAQSAMATAIATCQVWCESLEVARAWHLYSMAEQAAAQRALATVAAQEATKRVETASAVWHLADLSHRASVLAVELVDGAACPVCGADEHPSPAKKGVADLALLAQAKQGETEQQRLCFDTLTRAVATHESALADVDTYVKPEKAPSVGLQICEARVSELESQVAACTTGHHRAAVRLATEEEALRRAADERNEALETFETCRGDLTALELPSAVKRLQLRDEAASAAIEKLAALEDMAAARDAAAAKLSAQQRDAEKTLTDMERVVTTLRANAAHWQGMVLEGTDPSAELVQLQQDMQRRLQEQTEAEKALQKAQQQATEVRQRYAAAVAAHSAAQRQAVEAEQRLAALLSESGLSTAEEASRSTMAGEDLSALAGQVSDWHAHHAVLARDAEVSRASLGDAEHDPVLLRAAIQQFEHARQQLDLAAETLGGTQRALSELTVRRERHATLTSRRSEVVGKLEQLETLRNLVRGDKMVDWLANDHLHALCRDASEHLRALTRGRYHLEIDEEAAFLIGDADAGGALRPVSSLSGGETFLASLALALALSSQVQLQGRHPLEFFFLDEGFGSLDADSLDRVLTAIERLGSQRLLGLISHVNAVGERVPRYLEVNPAGAGATGTRLRIIDN
jgi:DNA repair protein SbcC/Rad50